MEDQPTRIGSPPRPDSAEGRRLREDAVQAILARLARGEGVKRIARELGVDRKTVKRWRRVGRWQPRQSPPRPRPLDPFVPFLQARGPEVDGNGMVLWRELRAQGFTGGDLQIQRFLQPLRTARRWAAAATVRFETGPGEQAQIDFGETQLWIGDRLTRVHLFVFTLGFSRRLWAQAYPHERLDVILAGQEGAFRHFGGVPLEVLYDNPRTVVLGRRDGQVLWHSAIEDLARYVRLHPPRLPALPGADQGQGGKRRQIHQAQRPGRAPVRLLGGAQRVAAGVVPHRRGPPRPRHHA